MKNKKSQSTMLSKESRPWIKRRIDGLRSCRSFIVCCLAAMMTSCASVSVYKQREAEKARFEAPQKIYVRDFQGEDANFRVDRKSDSLSEFRKKITAQLSGDIVKRLSEAGFAAEPLPEGIKMPKGPYWLVGGSFDRVNQGSRLLRALVGLGAGGTKVETTVAVSSLSQKPPREFLTFKTSGGSNTEPGPGALILPTNPLDVILPIVWASSMTGLTKDTSRTAKEITATLSEYLTQKGVPTQNPKLKPKRMRGKKANA